MLVPAFRGRGAAHDATAASARGTARDAATASARRAAGEAADGAAAETRPASRTTRKSCTESRNWLALIDADKAGQAWDGAGAQLKASVSRAKWIDGIRGIRKPYGRLVSREMEKVARTHTIPGAPEGDYAIVQFDSVFANGKHATEMVTWTLNETSWRVSGYQVR